MEKHHDKALYLYHYLQLEDDDPLRWPLILDSAQDYMRLAMRADDPCIYKVFVLDVYGDQPGEFMHEMCAWYMSYTDARRCVDDNVGDIQDHAFNYAMISRSRPGLYGTADEELDWFQWDADKREWVLVDMSERPSACAGFLLAM